MLTNVPKTTVMTMLPAPTPLVPSPALVTQATGETGRVVKVTVNQLDFNIICLFHCTNHLKINAARIQSVGKMVCSVDKE